MKFTIKRIFFALLALLLITALYAPKPVLAQSKRLVYAVQVGDTVDSIARAFHTSEYRMLQFNYLTDADSIYVGQKLAIPGFDDIKGEVIRVPLPLGESVSAYLGSLHQPMQVLNRINFITNIDQYYAGAPIYEMYTDQPAVKEVPLTSDLTGLELAVKQNVSEWSASEFNALSGPLMLLPNTTLWLPDENAVAGVENKTKNPALTISPYPLLQGKTEEFVSAVPAQGAALSGSLSLSVNDSLGVSTDYTPTSYDLRFFPTNDTQVTALQGVHRFAKPGLASMVITTTYADGSTFSYEQNLQVKEQDYGVDPPLQVDPETIDPAVTVPEWTLIKKYIQDAPPDKLWTNGFQSPSPTPDTFTDLFGRVRSYNGSDLIYFHSGVDYPGNYSTPIFAAADGVVVYTGELDVRGGATIISHGRGVYTGYWHQSKIMVNVGDKVTAGEKIGMVGDKGRVTGAHLHFEVFIGGVQVDPTEWLEKMY
jgi:murein DD-endopeptidase MepM/ murein hydrolase activator NlpD